MLLYAFEICGMTRLSKIEKGHLFACKRLLSISDKTSNHMVYGETGRYPLTLTTLFLFLGAGLNSVSCPVQSPETSFNYAQRQSNYEHEKEQ